MPTFAVVVPVLATSNAQISMTWKCLELARKKTKVPFELIIVESGNSYFQNNCDVYIYEREVTTPEVSHNRGFLVATRKDFIILLTNDVFVTDNWIETLYGTFRRKGDCGLATLGTTLKGHAQQDVIEEAFWFDVCMIDKAVFDKVGFYDERFVRCWCDTDLLIRAYKSGFKMYRNYNCIVDGMPPHTTVGQNPDFNANYLNGQRLFQEKHAGCGLEVYEKYK